MSLVLRFVTLALESPSLSSMARQQFRGRLQRAPCTSWEPTSLGQPPKSPVNQGCVLCGPPSELQMSASLKRWAAEQRRLAGASGGRGFLKGNRFETSGRECV